MDGLLVILIIIFFAVQSKNKKKKKGRDGSAAKPKTPIERSIQSGFSDMKAFMEKVEDILDDDEKVAPARMPARKLTPRRAAPVDRPAVIGSAGRPAGIPEGMKTPVAASAQGRSMMDAQGCVGGSMPHTRHEGETRDEHARHVRRIREEEQEAILAEDIARELQAMNVQRLRRAIVVSEILDKPKALRRR